MLEKDNSDGDIDAYCYEYDNVNNHHMAYDVDKIVKGTVCLKILFLN